MRKLLLSAVILLNVPAAALAQTASFGVTGGLTMARFGGERIMEADHRTGPTVGAFASIALSGSVAIQPEVLFSRKGARSAAYDYSDIPADGDGPPIGVYIAEQTSHDYLEIPILLKLSPSPGASSARPIFFAGPSIGVLLDAKEVHDTDYEEYLNSTDFGVIIGGGVEIGRFSLDARYNVGLSTVDRDYEASFGTVEGSIKNRAFSVMAGVRLF